MLRLSNKPHNGRAKDDSISTTKGLAAMGRLVGRRIARTKPVARVAEAKLSYADEVNTEEYLKILEQEMTAAAEAMDFERAALVRDQIFELKAAGK